MQNAWGQILNKVIGRAQNNSTILTDVELAIGSNTIQHGLGFPLSGWSVVRINGVASLYDTQATNTNPSATLILVSSAVVTVNLEVF